MPSKNSRFRTMKRTVCFASTLSAGQGGKRKISGLLECPSEKPPCECFVDAFQTLSSILSETMFRLTPGGERERRCSSPGGKKRI